MTLAMLLKRALCFLVGYREYDSLGGGTRCMRCHAGYNHLDGRWRRPGETGDERHG